MALFVWQGLSLQGGSTGCQACNDGTYVYFALRDSSNNITLYKLRHSDKQIVAQVAALNSGGYSPAVMTDGTSVLVSQHGSGLRRFLCSDLSDQGLCVSSSSLGSASEGGTFDGTYFWIGGSFATVMARITPNTWAVSTYGNNTTLGNVINVIEPAGANLMMAGGYGGGYSGMRLVNKSGTVLWDNRAVVTQSILAMSYDAIRDEIWANGDGMEALRIRASDGVLLDRDGTVQATLNAAKIVTGTYPDSNISNSFGIAVTGDTLFASAATSPFYMQARATAPPAYSAGLWQPIGGTYRGAPGVARKFTIVGKTLYGVFNGNGWSTSGIMWLDFSLATPTVVSVNPDTNGLNVTLDSSVNVGTPTFGVPTTKLAVSGATQASSTSIHVVVDPIAPKLSTAAANGTGIDLVFDLPVGLVGSPSYGGIANNLQVTLAAPVSGTEIQLTANAITPKITTAKANTSGVDLVFDRPVSLGTTPDYGATVNNLTVVTANPLSATEVQLFTTISSNTYEWLAAPINVTGVGILPYVATAYARDNTTFVLIFSEAVVESSAVNISNYAITPALDIIEIVKVNSTTYAMTTSPQTANTVYHVTLTGIIDPANNPI